MPPVKGTQILLFTMDSITQYTSNSLKGGPGGEILIRSCLTAVLFESYPGVSLTVATSDQEMLALGASRQYDVYIFDPWTWAQRGWVLRDFVQDPGKLLILDFFGSEVSYTARGKGGGVPQPFDVNTGVLTAYPAPKDDATQAYPHAYHGTFLGFFLDEEQRYDAALHGEKERRSVLIWGKSLEYFENNVDLLRVLDEDDSIRLVSVLAEDKRAGLSKYGFKSIAFLGHLTKDQWLQALYRTEFVLGLQDPLLGPTGVEAVAAGCIVINPRYGEADVRKGRGRGHRSQHGYLEDYDRGRGRVCTVEYRKESGFREVLECIDGKGDGGGGGGLVKEGVIMEEFQKGKYEERVREIFKRFAFV
jgi:hypothetical protein